MSYYYEREPFDFLAALQIIDPSADAQLPWPSMPQAIASANASRERTERLVAMERPLGFEARLHDVECLGKPEVAKLLERLCGEASELGLSYGTFTRLWSQVCAATADAHLVAPRREDVQAKIRKAGKAKAAVKTLLELLDSSERIQRAAAQCLDRELYNQSRGLWMAVALNRSLRWPERSRGPLYVYSSQLEIFRNTLQHFASALTDAEPLRPTGGRPAKVYAENLMHEFSVAFGKPRLKDVLILVGVLFGSEALSQSELEGIRREQTRRGR